MTGHEVVLVVTACAWMAANLIAAARLDRTPTRRRRRDEGDSVRG